MKQLQEEELRQLFNEGISGQFGKKKSKAQSAASQLGLTEANKDISEFLEALSSDSSDDEDDLISRRKVCSPPFFPFSPCSLYPK
jgi:hypothetical protein